MALSREKQGIEVWYGVDPCEVVEDDVHILDKDDTGAKMDIPVLAGTDSSMKDQADW